MNMLMKSAALLLMLALCGSAWAGRDYGDDGPKSGRGWKQDDHHFSQQDDRRGAQDQGRRQSRSRFAEQMDVCDPLIGGTPGLFGMCLSYCKATELEEVGSLSAEKLEFIAAKKQKVLARYNELKQTNDLDMPCIKKDACPCWGSEQTSTGFWLSRSRPPVCNLMENPPESRGNLIAGSSTGSDSASMISYVNPVAANSFCLFSDQSDGTRTLQQVSDSDAMVCATQLQATCSLLP